MTTVGCFCHRRFKHTKDAKDKTDAENRCPPLIEDKEPHGAEWLWSKHIVKLYLILVDRSTESATREAAIRALQNLTAGKGALSKSVATILQKEGLQKIREILNEDGQLKNSAIALITNLSYFPELQTTIKCLPKMPR